ncbi:MAG: EamA/RhaT family transporter, partial [Pseudomonadota bacterium]
HIAMTLSFRYAEASRLAPFEYVALVWPVIADVLIFDLIPTTAFLFAVPLLLAGAAVAAGEGRRKPIRASEELSRKS